MIGSQLYAELWRDPEAEALFSDQAELAAMLRVEGGLARVQGRLGVIPKAAAEALAAFLDTVVLAPEALAKGVGRDGVPVPALVATLRTLCPDPAAAQYLHWGATSQDIVDTALALRLAALCDLWQARLKRLLAELAELAEAEAEAPMAARTYGQIAVPSSFGALVAAWGWGVLAAARALPDIRAGVAQVSLSGAAGTLAAMGPQGPAVRAALAAELGLADPGHSWHSVRAGLAALAGWAGVLGGALGKMAEDVLLAQQSGREEVRLDEAGGSSTMPQKRNPVRAAALSALVRLVGALVPAVQAASVHREARDGAAWFSEWLALPPLCLALSRALALADALLGGMRPDRTALARPLAEPPALAHAEALTFALSQRLPRAKAMEAVRDLAMRAGEEGRNLLELARTMFPWVEHAGPDLGQAPAEARAFAAKARAWCAEGPS